MPPSGRPRNPPWCPCIRGDMRTARALWRMPFTIRTSRLTEKGWGSTFWPQASCLYSYIRYVYVVHMTYIKLRDGSSKSSETDWEDSIRDVALPSRKFPIAPSNLHSSIRIRILDRYYRCVYLPQTIVTACKIAILFILYWIAHS